MKKPDFEKWIDVMKDKEILKILFFLQEFNPNVTTEDLKKNLNIEEQNLNKKLTELENLGIIEQINSMFRLTKEGKVMIEGMYSDMGEKSQLK